MTHASFSLPYHPSAPRTSAADIAAQPVEAIITSLWSIKGFFALARLVVVLAPMAMK